MQKFPNLFKQEVGWLKDFKLEITFKLDATLVFHKPRTVPYKLQEDLHAAYEAGIQRGVWVSTSFNEYETPVVPIRKTPLLEQRKAKLRVCVCRLLGHSYLSTRDSSPPDSPPRGPDAETGMGLWLYEN